MQTHPIQTPAAAVAAFSLKTAMMYGIVAGGSVVSPMPAARFARFPQKSGASQLPSGRLCHRLAAFLSPEE